jgi:protein-tyrosine-phosphatase/predicted ATP-grasp superfamily ATP-dependent carboligase
MSAADALHLLKIMPVEPRPLRILLTDAQTRAGLGAMRSLGQAGHTVIAGYPEDVNRPPSLSSRHCRGVLQLPNPERHPSAFGDWMVDRAHREDVDAVLPISEAAVFCIAARRGEFPTTFLPLLPSDGALKHTLSKFHSTRMALEMGIPCPETVFLSSGWPHGQWRKRLAEIRFPAIIKTDNYLTAEGTYRRGRRFVVRSVDEVEKIMAGLAGLDVRIIAQELVPGSGLGTFLLRFGGRTHLTFAHRRLHEVPYTGGFSSFRESYHADGLVRASEALLEAIDYDGVAMVEFRRRSTDGTPLFLEINGRLWGSLALALHCGVDFPAALVDCYQYGAPRHTPPGYRANVKSRNIVPGEIHYVRSVLKARPAEGYDAPPSKVKTLIEFVALSLDPRIGHDYFWWSDPLPAIHHLRDWLLGLVRHPLRETRRRLQHRWESLMFQRLRRKHEARCREARYFEQPLARIMFLCHGNIGRSAFAAGYWNARIAPERPLAAPAAVSFGVHPASGRRAPDGLAHIAAGYGVNLSGHRSRPITKLEADAADAIFVMDRANYRMLIAQFPSVKSKTYFLGWFAEHGPDEIADPYTKDEELARRCCKQIVASIEGLVNRVVAPAHRAPVQEVACLGGLTIDGDFLQIILELPYLVDVFAGRVPLLGG